MSDHFLLLVSCAGLTFLLAQASILDKPRSWMTSRSPFLNSMLSCAFCTGFWVGILVFLIDWKFEGFISVAMLFLNGLASSVFSMLFDAALDVKESIVRIAISTPVSDDEDFPYVLCADCKGELSDEDLDKGVCHRCGLEFLRPKEHDESSKTQQD